MDWQRERDGLVVVGTVVVLLVVVAVGGVRGFVTTFAATFLGILAALRVNGALGSEAGTTSEEAGATVAPAAVGEADTVESVGSVGPTAGATPADVDETTRESGAPAAPDDTRSEPADGDAAAGHEPPQDAAATGTATTSESDVTSPESDDATDGR